MKVDDFLKLMQKVSRFKTRLDEEGIPKNHQQIIMKVYLNDVIPKVNTGLLRKVI